MESNLDLKTIWTAIEIAGYTAVHAYRDWREPNKWHCQLLHPDMPRKMGTGNSYEDALVNAINQD